MVGINSRQAEVVRLVQAIRIREREVHELKDKLDELLDEDKRGERISVGGPKRSLNSSTTEQILLYAREHAGRGFTPAHLAEVVGSTNSASIRQLVIRLERKGELTKFQRGRWGAPPPERGTTEPKQEK